MDKDVEKYSELADIFRALGHPVRLCIVRGLLNKGICNVTYMQDCLALPQSTISQHLQKLRAAKIITGQRNGLEINYKVSNEKVIALMNTLFKEED